MSTDAHLRPEALRALASTRRSFALYGAPAWYAVTQTVCTLPVIRVAFLARGTAPKTAFPKAG